MSLSPLDTFLQTEHYTKIGFSKVYSEDYTERLFNQYETLFKGVDNPLNNDLPGYTLTRYRTFGTNRNYIIHGCYSSVLHRLNMIQPSELIASYNTSYQILLQNEPKLLEIPLVMRKVHPFIKRRASVSIPEPITINHYSQVAEGYYGKALEWLDKNHELKLDPKVFNLDECYSLKKDCLERFKRGETNGFSAILSLYGISLFCDKSVISNVSTIADSPRSEEVDESHIERIEFALPGFGIYNLSIKNALENKSFLMQKDELFIDSARKMHLTEQEKEEFYAVS